METNYTVNLGELFKILPDLKKYLWQTIVSTKPTINKVITFVILDIGMTTIIQSHGCYISVDKEEYN